MEWIGQIPWWSYPLAVLLLIFISWGGVHLYRRATMTQEERWREKYDRGLKKSIKRHGR